MNFFEQFASEWGCRLGRRRDTFFAMFQLLSQYRERGHVIVETGCTRQADNWAGDGQSTFLFDRFASSYEGQVYSVDIDPKACAYARSIVSSRTTVTTADSVPFLQQLGMHFVRTGCQADLLYLDSFDWDPVRATTSAVHHLKELCAIMPAIGPKTLVVIDDAFRELHGVRTSASHAMVISDQGIGGKAKYVAEFFHQIGATMVFEGYQCGWIMPDQNKPMS